jgi:release factor glutamine methyltransferase
MTTVHQALRKAAARISETGSDEAALEAEILLMHVTGLDRSHVYERLEEELPAARAEAFAACVERRLNHEPVPYITGHKEFFALDFEVTPAALIPRPETETLVELVLAFVRERFGAGACTIADVGVGSGIIAVSLAHELPQASVMATDTSKEALALARRNAERHGVADRITFAEGDLLQPLTDRVDVIAANLPYVAAADWEALPPEIREHEPRTALDGGPDGLRVVERLLAAAPRHLRPSGALFEEMGDEQGAQASETARRYFPEADIRVERDLAGRDRVLCVYT